MQIPHKELENTKNQYNVRNSLPLPNKTPKGLNPTMSINQVLGIYNLDHQTNRINMSPNNDTTSNKYHQRA